MKLSLNISPGTEHSPLLHVEQVSVRFGAVTALDRVSVSVASGEIVCLLGPSGSGKSTLLRLIAGVDRPTSGRIAIDGREVAGPRTFVEPESRRVGMVFQDYALFPHLSVSENVAFGLKGQRRADIDKSVTAMLDRVGMGRYADSYPHMLSGGERQRIALARALAPNPRLLLMDEPFSSLDGRLRDRVRQQTMELLRGTHTTTVLVTHDADEAMRVADRIALLKDGRLVQCGSPRELYAQPATLFAARFFSEVTELRGMCRDGQIHTALGCFDASHLGGDGPAAVCIRPQHLRIADRPTNVCGRVVRSEFRGEADHVLVAVNGLDAPVTLRALGHPPMQPGAAVHLEVHPSDVLVVAADQA